MTSDKKICSQTSFVIRYLSLFLVDRRHTQFYDTLCKMPHRNFHTNFYRALDAALQRRGRTRDELGDFSNAVVRRVLIEYGALFVASEKVSVPPVCIFTNGEQVEDFQNRAGWHEAQFGDITIELQPAALAALLAAKRDAHNENSDITPRGNAEAGRRSFEDTLRLWNSRVAPALAFWTNNGKLSAHEASHVRALQPHEQIGAVLEFEARGIFFSRDFSKTILQSVAAPGASQHLSMLAFDANEFQDERVREILARHGWFQTVRSDLPHFTFLGLCEKDLASHGLRPVEEFGHRFWIPNIAENELTLT